MSMTACMRHIRIPCRRAPCYLSILNNKKYHKYTRFGLLCKCPIANFRPPPPPLPPPKLEPQIANQAPKQRAPNKRKAATESTPKAKESWLQNNSNGTKTTEPTKSTSTTAASASTASSSVSPSSSASSASAVKQMSIMAFVKKKKEEAMIKSTKADKLAPLNTSSSPVKLSSQQHSPKETTRPASKQSPPKTVSTTQSPPKPAAKPNSAKLVPKPSPPTRPKHAHMRPSPKAEGTEHAHVHVWKQL